jgi:hypothetical protein
MQDIVGHFVIYDLQRWPIAFVIWYGGRLINRVN